MSAEKSRLTARSRLPGELSLWAAVLQLAVWDFRYSPRCKSAARAWLWSPAHSLGSFLWIADLFGLDPCAVRTALLGNDRPHGNQTEMGSTDNPELLAYPPIASQWFDGGSFSKEQSDGMIFCPQRKAQIAEMRCGEYQETFHCGQACQNATTPERLDVLKLALRPDDPELPMLRCATCGAIKKTPQGTRCTRCAGALNGGARLLKSRRENGHASDKGRAEIVNPGANESEVSSEFASEKEKAAV